MSKEDKKAILQELTDIILHSHVSRDKEVSGLFREIRDGINDNRAAIAELREEVGPVVDAYKTASAGSRIIIFLAKAITGLGAVVVASAAIIKFVKSGHV